jgi:hypothetical protein
LESEEKKKKCLTPCFAPWHVVGTHGNYLVSHE